MHGPIVLTGLGKSVPLAVTDAGQEIELPKLPNGFFASSYLVQQLPTADSISFTIGPSGAAFTFGSGPITPGDGSELIVDNPPGTNNFLLARMFTGKTGSIVITPIGG